MAIQRKPLTQVNFVCLDLPYDSGSAPLPFSLLTSFALADSYPGPFNYRVPIGGSWKLKAGLVSTPSFVSFSEIGVGLSSLATVTLTNADITEQPLTVGTLTAPFSLVSTTCSTSLAPGSSCAINLAFTPTAAGNASSSLPLSWGTPASAMALLLTGSAATPSGPVPLGRPGVWEAAIGNYAGSSGQFLGIDSQGRSILNQVGESPCLEISVYPHAGADITSPVTCVDLTATGSSSQVALWGDTVIAFDNANASYIKVSLATQVHTALPNLDPNGANANRRFGTTLLRGRSDTSWLYSPATDQMVDSSAWDAVLAPVLNEQIPVFTPMAYDDATQTVVGYYAVSGGVQVFRARLGEAATSVFVPIEPHVLSTTLRELFNQEEVTRLLGLTEPQDEAFWKLQQNAVTHRFLSYLLFQLDMPLTLERLEMTLNEAASLQTLARACLTDGLTYEKVRNWWLTQGKVLHSRAFALKHEKEFLATRCLRVLCFFENKRPLWLNYGADGTATLHEDRDSAFEFPVNSSTELLPQSCERLADEFKVMCKLIGATSVKVLPGAKADTPQDIESPEAEATP